MQQTSVPGWTRTLVIAVDKFALWFSHYWLAVFITLYGAWVLVPFVAPVLMQMGAAGPAGGIYFFYSFFCHQLPERSLFFFGPKLMYSYSEIKAVWPLDGFGGLRQFIGNPDMGYKMAWSDRMISFYGSLWVGAILYGLLRSRLKPLPAVAWFIFGIMPVGLDGLTHMLNDALSGTDGTGFRDTNTWLQALTGHLLPSSFYVGDALGSFNSDMRWITGILFGLMTIWFIFPFIETSMQDVEKQVTEQLKRAHLIA